MLFAFLAVITTLALTYRRLFYGVDFTDEAFYSGIPYEFVLGIRPFIDELNFLTFPSLILYPFIKVFYMLNNGTEGLILYNRHLFLLFFIMVSCIVFFVLRRVIFVQAAILVSATCLAFIPLNIPALGYNTLSTGMLTIGFFLSYYAIYHNRKPLYFLLSGFALGLAVVSYPTLIIPFIVYILILLGFLIKKSSISTWFLFIAGSTLAAIPILIMMWMAGIDNVIYFIENLGYVGKQGGGTEKIWDHIGLWYSNLPNKWILLVVLLIIALTAKKKNMLYLLSLVLLPVLSFPFQSKEPLFVHSQIWVTNYSMLMLVLFIIHMKDKTIRRMFTLIFLPSLLAGITYLWSSSNGYLASGLGLFPAFLALSGLIIYLIQQSESHKSVKTVLSFSVPLFIIINLLLLQQQSVYRDQDINTLTNKVESGPYKGLFTSKTKSEFMETLRKDMNLYAKGSKTIFFYNHFPAGYLFSDIKPAGNTIWIFYYSKNRYIHADYLEKNGEPDTVIRMKVLVDANLTPLRYYKKDELNNLIKEKYRIVHTNQYYDLLQKK
ncbi:hypothetical protein AWM68_13410 [Fictibacillus phosphorivorans]|uniref:Glycosyltransferase RgtA/B/C/D-like domain-containing protein n=1 Tax=Fictibacillus phosphorivorans TaxID=1221500 RepID=A0A163PTA1_9BACL|nr:hypothetical protein [Fictibacillus phosphorivorans]KZE64098.1 hypothetical protein AWM68_13410 [Fictibacillus phosphorivorans]